MLPGCAERGDTALHIAIAQEDNSSLHLVDFLVQNSKDLNIPNLDGNTPLHICVLMDQSEAIKLLLKANADIHAVNAANKTPFNLAQELNRKYILELVCREKSI